MLRILVTGGAGFIGTNLAIMLSHRGHEVIVLDAFAKEGSRTNAGILQKLPNVRILEHDLTRPLSNACMSDCIVHLAANVDADKASRDPRWDLHVNAGGTLNILEYARSNGNIPIVYASTCKVYSSELNDLPLIERERRYEYANIEAIDESREIDARCRYGHSPYGCSKYAGEMYVQEYHTLFGLAVIINRMSTIYGPHQHGVKGYGWVHWFTAAIKQDLPITIFGNGKQVRDVLHVDDLCRLLLKQVEEIDKHTGEIYNVGGGIANTLSLLELVDMLIEIKGKALREPPKYEEWRAADFKVYISDITKVSKKAHWHPEVSIKKGVERLWKEF